MCKIIFCKNLIPMRIDHLAMWVIDLGVMRDFYMKYFNATSGEKYINEKKKFASYFLTFEGGARLEIMSKNPLGRAVDDGRNIKPGLTHFAISVGSEENVLHKTEELRKDGYMVEGEPRWTGDGYFESVVLDPEGNFIEITI